MKLQVLALFDAKAETFDRPQFYTTIAVGLRALVAAARSDNEGMLLRFGRDFTVFKIGEYDQSNGKLESCPPFDLGTIADLARPQRVDDAAEKIAKREAS